MADDIYADGEYLRNNPNWHVEDSAWKASKIVAILDKNAIRPQQVVEIGCGAGEILAQLHRAMPKSTEFTGYEISPHAFALSQRRETDRLRFVLGDFLNEGPCGCDCALIIDVIEHVEDYIGFVRTLQPKARYHVFHIPLEMSALGVLRGWMLQTRVSLGHIHYFSAPTVLAALQGAGYRVVDTAYTCGDREQPKVQGFGIRIFRVMRDVAGIFSVPFAAKLFGGFSLLVLAEGGLEREQQTSPSSPGSPL